MAVLSRTSALHLAVQNKVAGKPCVGFPGDSVVNIKPSFYRRAGTVVRAGIAAAGFAARAMADDTDAYCRAAYLRLAVRYGVLAAQREIEEGRTTRG